MAKKTRFARASTAAPDKPTRKSRRRQEKEAARESDESREERELPRSETPPVATASRNTPPVDSIQKKDAEELALPRFPAPTSEKVSARAERPTKFTAREEAV